MPYIVIYATLLIRDFSHDAYFAKVIEIKHSFNRKHFSHELPPPLQQATDDRATITRSGADIMRLSLAALPWIRKLIFSRSGRD
jgi:hypothetical protein